MSIATTIPTRPANKVKVRGRKPRRVQRRRTKGWNMPSTAVFVGRGTPFGNGWRIGDPHPDTNQPMTRADVVAYYRDMLADAPADTLARIRDLLGGYDLACWCTTSQACHADVLLRVANDAPADVWLYLHPEDAQLLAAGSAAALFVREFHETYGHPIRTEPVANPPESDLRTRLLREEAGEYADAEAADDQVGRADGLADLVYVAYGAALTHGIDLDAQDDTSPAFTLTDAIDRYYAAVQDGDVTVVGDSLAAVVAICRDEAEHHGIPLDAVVAEVHRSNMSKLGEDGQPIKRPDGKVLKGPNYSPPNIAAVLEREAV